MDQIGSTVTTAVAGMQTELLAVGGAGIALGLLMWGLPKAVGFFRKTAK